MDARSEEWSEEKRRRLFISNGVVFGKFRENDEATMQILKIGVEDSELKEEIRLKIEHQEKILNSPKRELRGLQMISLDEWIEKNCG